MEKVKTEFLKTQNLKPLSWLQYTDNVFFMWTHGEEQLKTFMNNINNYISNLKFITYEYSKNEINFLDLKVEFEEGSLVTNVYIKPRNRHQYLHHHSSCLDHIKRSITYIQALRVNRLCFGKKIFLITPAK